MPLTNVFFGNEAEFEANIKQLITKSFPEAQNLEEGGEGESSKDDQTNIEQPAKKLKQDSESSLNISETTESTTGNFYIPLYNL